MPAVPNVSRQSAIQAIEEQFSVDKTMLESLVERFQELYHYGLANHGADMQMIPSFVTGVPDGSEKGTYLALDIGGTNLRVCEWRSTARAPSPSSRKVQGLGTAQARSRA